MISLNTLNFNVSSFKPISYENESPSLDHTHKHTHKHTYTHTDTYTFVTHLVKFRRYEVLLYTLYLLRSLKFISESSCFTGLTIHPI